MLKAVFVMIDGLRPDAIDRAACPTLKSLMQQGSYTLTATSVMPSVTLPCHTSIFYSVPPTRHGITSNDWTPMARPLPGLVEVAHAAGLRCGSFHNWEPLRNLNRPESLYSSFFRDNSTDLSGDEANLPLFTRLIADNPLDFAFVYLGNVDTAGHKFGWMSADYLSHVERADKTLGQLLERLPPEVTVLVHADHGGHDRSHGTDSADDMTIPWVIRGPGIKAGYQIPNSVSLLDTTPTLARLLGLQPHREWEGRCVEEIFI